MTVSIPFMLIYGENFGSISSRGGVSSNLFPSYRKGAGRPVLKRLDTAFILFNRDKVRLSLRSIYNLRTLSAVVSAHPVPEKFRSSGTDLRHPALATTSSPSNYTLPSPSYPIVVGRPGHGRPRSESNLRQA